jgi:hypothetical protein
MDESSSQLEPAEDLSSDLAQEEADPSSIIVIHPGSKYLRIGLASDPMPKRLLHAIARKRKSPLPNHSRIDPLLVPKVIKNSILVLRVANFYSFLYLGKPESRSSQLCYRRLSTCGSNASDLLQV